ncbi:hypothetical protein ACFV6F_30950 [Kitasatospora phosalacinea]|uniref:hypothetical protein n=1 Tax=Kitasatospora phosalacinea TaxID=2065 RepID=UPI0036695A63
MFSPVGACRSTSPDQCVAALCASVTEATGWAADSAVLSVGTEATRLARVLVAERAPLLSFDSAANGSAYGEPSLAHIAASPWLLPALGLPTLSLAIVSGHPPGRTGQLLQNLDAILGRDAAVLFVESRSVPDLLNYAPPVGGSPFHQMRAVVLTHTACVTEPSPVSPSHHSGALAASRS